MQRFWSDNNIIYLWDSLKVLESIPDESIDLIFADPPYNIWKNFAWTIEKRENEESYIEWCKIWLDLCIKKLKKNGSFYVMTATQFMPYFDIFLRKKINILSRIIRSYDSSWVQAKKYYWSMYEPILFCVKDKNNYTFNWNDILVEAKTWAKRKLIDYRKAIPTPYNSQKIPGNVWEFPRVRYRMEEYENHPTQKPEALLERIIRASSNEWDLVMDPFSWTFTTWAVAKRLWRKTIWIEIQEEYVKIWLRRLGISNEFNWEKLYKVRKIYDKQPVENLFSDLSICKNIDLQKV